MIKEYSLQFSNEKAVLDTYRDVLGNEVTAFQIKLFCYEDKWHYYFTTIDASGNTLGVDLKLFDRNLDPIFLVGGWVVIHKDNTLSLPCNNTFPKLFTRLPSQASITMTAKETEPRPWFAGPDHYANMPEPSAQDIFERKARAYTIYKETLDRTLTNYFESVSQSTLYVDNSLVTLKAHLMRKWMKDNQFMPEIEECLKDESIAANKRQDDAAATGSSPQSPPSTPAADWPRLEAAAYVWSKHFPIGTSTQLVVEEAIRLSAGRLPSGRST